MDSLHSRFQQLLLTTSGQAAFGLVLALALYGLSAKLRARRRNPKGLPLPPGPPRLPIIGNAHQLVGKSIVAVMDKWANEYGPIVHIDLFGTPAIVISSADVARDLMETRFQNYSGRPNFLLASKAMQGEMMMPFIHANERFRKTRKLVTTEMRSAAVTQYFNPVQAAEVHRLVKAMIDDPVHWTDYVQRAIASIIMTAVYDKPLRTGQPPEQVVQDVVRLNDELVTAIDAGKNYVDFLPWMRFVPFAPYKQAAREYYELAERTYRYLMDEAKQNLEAGKPANSVAARVLERPEEQEADYREQYWALGSFFLAGSDTQNVSSQTLMLALALHPHVLERAQAAVDDVVGSERLPSYADMPRLPYITAMIKEVFRWRPVGPIAIPHGSINDDTYNGYFIPGGATIMPNIWSIHHDRAVFDRPEDFEPQRYVDDPSLPAYVFGFGRRVCPGQRVAEHTLFLEFATIVWALDVRQAVDPKTGEKIPIDADRDTGFKPGGVMKPHEFAVAITPRSQERCRLLARAVEDEGL